MIESLITISLVGFLVGFIFSMPVAGPIGILIASNSLHGRIKFSIRAAAGAAFVDFFYCFIAVVGFAQLFNLYEQIIPYILSGGSVFIIYLGINIARTRLDIKTLNRNILFPKRVKQMKKKGGFRTGVMINLLNPMLFFGWMTASFIVMSFVASLGFNVGGLDDVLGSNVESIHYQTKSNISLDSMRQQSAEQIPETDRNLADASDDENEFGILHLLIGVSYALFVSFGTLVWFYYFSRFLARNRRVLKMNALNRLIHALGFILIGFGIYLIYTAFSIFTA